MAQLSFMGVCVCITFVGIGRVLLGDGKELLCVFQGSLSSPFTIKQLRITGQEVTGSKQESPGESLVQSLNNSNSF